MIPLLYTTLLIMGVRGQTGTCCYNPDCAIPNLEAWSAFNLTRSTLPQGFKSLPYDVNEISCCPSGGDAFIKHNGGSSADVLCRCYDGGFIQQTCPYSSSDALACSNVPASDEECPDSKVGVESIDYVKSCIHWSSDGKRYVPQRCPTRLICLKGMHELDSPGWNTFASFDGTYFTNSSLYYYGAPLYRFRDAVDGLQREIRLENTDGYWKVIVWWSNGDGSIYAQLPVLSGAYSNNIEWDPIGSQSYATVWGRNWETWDGSFVQRDVVYLTDGECPDTGAPTVVPTVFPTELPTASPIGDPTVEPTASPTDIPTVRTTQYQDNGSNDAIRYVTALHYILIVSIFFYVY